MKKVGRPPATRGKRIIVSEGMSSILVGSKWSILPLSTGNVFWSILCTDQFLGSGSEGSTEEPLCTFKSESSTTTESQTTESEEAVPIRSSRDTEKKAVTKAPPEKVPVIAPRPKGRPAADKQVLSSFCVLFWLGSFLSCFLFPFFFLSYSFFFFLLFRSVFLFLMKY